MVWEPLIQQYELFSSEPPSRKTKTLFSAVYSYSNAKIGERVYDLLTLHLINGEVSHIEHCRCSTNGNNVSWSLQKRDYDFNEGKWKRYKSIATYGLEPLPTHKLGPELLSALEELIQEQPEVETAVRKCLEKIK